MKPGFKAWLIIGSLTLAGSATAFEQPANPPNAQAALDAAAEALAEAQRHDAVWAVWDPGMPVSDEAAGLDEILAVAHKKHEAGDVAEATRMAEQVAFFARRGVEQAKRNQASGIPTAR